MSLSMSMLGAMPMKHSDKEVGQLDLAINAFHECAA